MYNVSVGPSKMVTKTRRGMNQKMDRVETHRENTKRSGDSNNVENINYPRPVFHTNQRKPGSNRQQEAATPEHEEVARFASECFNAVRREYDNHARNNSLGPNTVMYYKEEGPNTLLEDFKPFDFEAWWGRRLFNTITKSVP